MAYTTQAKIEALIPAPHLRDALDDDRDGVADTDLLDTVIANADNAVDAYLSGLYTVPFTTVPSAAAEASLMFACEAIYTRRLDALGLSERNPFKPRADFWRTRLEKIGNGELPLDNATDKEVVPGVAILDDVEVDESLRG